MKHIKRFNENNEENSKKYVNKGETDYDPKKGKGHSYKENLSRGNNEFVYQVLPELRKLVEPEIKTIIKK